MLTENKPTQSSKDPMPQREKSRLLKPNALTLSRSRESLSNCAYKSARRSAKNNEFSDMKNSSGRSCKGTISQKLLDLALGNTSLWRVLYFKDVSSNCVIQSELKEPLEGGLSVRNLRQLGAGI